MSERHGLLARPAMRWTWLMMVSPLMCSAIGCVAGGCYLAVASIAAGEPVTQALLAIPMAILASVIVAGPIGLVCGLVGAALALVLRETLLYKAGRSRWLAAGGGTGGAVGLCVPLWFGGGFDGLFALTAFMACGVAGVAVAWLGWRELGA